MSIQQIFRKLAAPIAAAVVLGVTGVAAHAVTINPQAGPDTPVDCKKTPKHPSCKDKR